MRPGQGIGFEVTGPGNGCGSGAIGLLPRCSLVRKAPYVASGAVREFERTGGRNRLSLLERIQKSQGEPGSPPKPPARALQPPPAPPQAPPAPRSAPSAPRSEERRVGK